MRLSIVAVAMVLLAAACGSNGTDDDQQTEAADVSDALRELQSRGSVKGALFVEVPTASLGPDGELVGLIPDLITELFRRLGVDEVEATALDFPAVLPAVIAGQFDFTATSFAYTQERCDTIAFSDPVMGRRLQYIVPKGNPGSVVDFESIRSGGLVQSAASGTIQEDIANENDLELLLVTTVPDMIAAVESGRADLTVLSDMVAADLNLSERFDLLPADEYPVSTTGVIFARENAELRDDFNRELAAMGEDGSWARILEDYGADPSLVIGTTRDDIVPDCF